MGAERGTLGSILGRLMMVAVAGLVVAGGISVAVPSVASAAPARASKLPRAARAHVAAATPSSVPGAPFIEEAISEGLAVLVNWDPNPGSDDVTAYKLTASVASGFTGKVSKKCAKPPAISAPGTTTWLYSEALRRHPLRHHHDGHQCGGDWCSECGVEPGGPSCRPAPECSPHHLGAVP